MDFKYTIQETLEARFTDRSEMEDLANHGAMSGFSGFIYTTELNEFFNEFEDDIENYYYDMFGNSWIAEMSTDVTSLDELRAHLVWGYIEIWCADKLEEDEEEESYTDSLLTAGV